VFSFTDFNDVCHICFVLLLCNKGTARWTAPLSYDTAACVNVLVPVNENE
jgi:hypothetical protein